MIFTDNWELTLLHNTNTNFNLRIHFTNQYAVILNLQVSMKQLFNIANINALKLFEFLFLHDKPLPPTPPPSHKCNIVAPHRHKYSIL